MNINRHFQPLDAGVCPDHEESKSPIGSGPAPEGGHGADHAGDIETGRIVPVDSSNYAVLSPNLRRGVNLMHDSAMEPTERTSLLGLGAPASAITPRFYDTPLQQVPPSREMVQAAIQLFTNQNQIIDAALSLLGRPARSKQTMAFLKCFNATDLTAAMTSLMSVNTGADWSSLTVILNNGENPFLFTVPSDVPGVNQERIRSPIIATNLSSNREGVARSPSRIPDAPENEKVKDYIYEAFEDYFGTEVAHHCLHAFMTPENKGRPLTVLKLQEVFQSLFNLYEDETRPDSAELSGRVQNLESVSVLLPGVPRSPIHEKEHTLALYAQGEGALLPSEQFLLRALWHSAETIARSTATLGAAVSAGVTGASLGAIGGALIGAVELGGIVGIGSALFHIASHLANNHEDSTDDSLRDALLAANADALLAANAGAPVGAFLGALLGFIVGTSRGGSAALSYFSPNVSAGRVWEALSDFRNPSALGSQAVELLQEAQEKDNDLRNQLTTFLSSFSPEVRTNFLLQLNQELSKQPPGAPALEGSSRTFEEVVDLLQEHLQARIAARTLLIQTLEARLAPRNTAESRV